MTNRIEVTTELFCGTITWQGLEMFKMVFHDCVNFWLLICTIVKIREGVVSAI